MDQLDCGMSNLSLTMFINGKTGKTFTLDGELDKKIRYLLIFMICIAYLGGYTHFMSNQRN